MPVEVKKLLREVLTVHKREFGIALAAPSVVNNFFGDDMLECFVVGSDTFPKRLDYGGRGLVYKRAGSASGVTLQVSLYRGASRTVYLMVPGMSLENVSFDYFVVEPAPIPAVFLASTDYAYFAVLNGNANLHELPADAAGPAEVVLASYGVANTDQTITVNPKKYLGADGALHTTLQLFDASSYVGVQLSGTLYNNGGGGFGSANLSFELYDSANAATASLLEKITTAYGLGNPAMCTLVSPTVPYQAPTLVNGCTYGGRQIRPIGVAAAFDTIPNGSITLWSGSAYPNFLAKLVGLRF